MKSVRKPLNEIIMFCINCKIKEVRRKPLPDSQLTWKQHWLKLECASSQYW